MSKDEVVLQFELNTVKVLFERDVHTYTFYHSAENHTVWYNRAKEVAKLSHLLIEQGSKLQSFSIHVCQVGHVGACGPFRQ